MNIRFYNARILSMADGFHIIENGELWVEGSRVAYVGETTVGHPSFDREIDLHGNLILPGFKNAHTHSAMTFLRSYADDLPLLEWLREQVFPMEAKLAEGDIYVLTKLAMMEYLTSGITACFDMYFRPEEVAAAAADMGFRTVMCGSINDFGGSVPELAALYKTYNSHHELVSYRLGFHAEYTTSPPMLFDLAGLSSELRAPVYTHNAESLPEVRQCVERNGTTPTVFLDRFGLFDYGGGGFHCVHMTDGDLAIFREKGLWAVTNPGSNCKLASGIAPLQKMADLGIGIAIGTDGPASNNCLDMFREMFLATALQKISLNDASAMDADKVLWMATVGGARAVGLHDCDVLAPGKQADLIVIDLHQPNMQPINNLTKNLVYSGSKQNVALTMVAGRILYENGVFHTAGDPEEVYRKANAIIAAKRKI